MVQVKYNNSIVAISMFLRKNRLNQLSIIWKNTKAIVMLVIVMSCANRGSMINVYGQRVKCHINYCNL